MKTIGIMTFHWATNYGAVLQAFSLQEYLFGIGYDVKVIDYFPATYNHSLIKCFRGRSIKKIRNNFMEWIKEKRIERFRRENLNRTRRYISDVDLNQLNYDIYICGSDQIWNPYYTMHGEGRKTLAYFLGFTNNNSKRIAYAASFGVSELSNEMIEYIKPQLATFDLISVRENSAKKLLESIGIKARVICDPVFLNDRIKYEILIQKCESTENGGIFGYVLHDDEKCREIVELISGYFDEKVITGVGSMGIEQWLLSLRNAHFIVTNSFHATAFALIFHVPFISVLINGSGMNDRILTLLECVDLSERAITKNDEYLLSNLLNFSIDWNAVDLSISNMRKEAKDFINSIF